MRFIQKLLEWISLKSWRSRRARDRYDFLKSKISERHFGGFAGLIVDFPGRRFKLEEIRSFFKPPMYQSVRNADGHVCIFWDRARLTREIGVGAPLKDGEVVAPDHQVRTKPSSTLETIDEKKPLTIPVVPSGQKKDV